MNFENLHHSGVVDSIICPVANITEITQVVIWFTEVLDFHLGANNHVCMFCVLSQNYQHLFWKIIHAFYSKLSKELKIALDLSRPSGYWSKQYFDCFDP